jgi:hypothetical protein
MKVVATSSMASRLMMKMCAAEIRGLGFIGRDEIKTSA